MKLEKLSVLIYFSLLHKMGSLYFCVVMQKNYLSHMKTKSLCIICILILKAKFVRKKCTLCLGKYVIGLTELEITRKIK